MMDIKPGVKVGGISPEIVLAVMVARDAYSDAGHAFTVTSILDGKHSAKSLHYTGYAVDLRTRHVPTHMRQALRDTIAAALGAEFDVVLEADHIHLEYDSKTGAVA